VTVVCCRGIKSNQKKTSKRTHTTLFSSVDAALLLIASPFYFILVLVRSLYGLLMTIERLVVVVSLEERDGTYLFMVSREGKECFFDVCVVSSLVVVVFL
jgi:hypothetical protein